MNIIGIDPATRKMGVGVIKVTRDGRVKYVDSIEISAPRKWDLNKRFLYIHDEVEKIFKKYKPKVVGIESQFFARNVASFRLVCYSVGLAWASAFAHERDVDVHIIEATKWRSLALDNGKAKKQDAIDAMCFRFDLNESEITDNMAEALGIGIAAHKIHLENNS